MRRANNNNVAGDFGRRCNNVAGEAGRRCCFVCCPKDDVLGVSDIALRGPGCINGTGRCGEFTASFVEGVFNKCGGQVSPTGNVQNQMERCRKHDFKHLECYCLETPITVPR